MSQSRAAAVGLDASRCANRVPRRAVLSKPVQLSMIRCPNQLFSTIVFVQERLRFNRDYPDTDIALSVAG
jgi:hypothetical protein